MGLILGYQVTVRRTTDHRFNVGGTKRDLTVRGCRISPVRSTETDDRGPVSETRYVMSAPWDADIRVGDQIVYRGMAFDVDGQPLKQLDTIAGQRWPQTVYLQVSG